MKKIFVAIATLCLLTGWSCGKYDDSALNGRMDDLEGRVDGLEAQLEALNAKLDGFNNALRGITDALNGGLITKVERNATDDGWVFTVSNAADGTSKTYEVKDGEGKQGPQGDPGTPGSTPVITTGYDETSGRYYWIIDDDDFAPDYKWATGAKGEQGEGGLQGEQGVAPWLAIAAASTADDSKPDFTNSDDSDELYWWVSYEYKGEGDRADYEWTKLYTANTTAVKLNLSVEYKDGKLIFYNEGVEIGSAEVQLSDNPLSLTFAIDGEDVDEYSTVKVLKGESVEIEVTMIGTSSENAIIKAELQNPGRGFEVSVEDNIITVEAVATADNKLLVEIQEGGNCFHSWLDLSVPLGGYIEVVGVNDQDYLPIAFGQGTGAAEGADFSSLDNVPAQLNVKLVLDVPAKKQIKANLSLADLYGAGAYMIAEDAITMPSTITVEAGQQEVEIPVSLNRAKLECDTYFSIAVESEDVIVAENETSIANNFMIKYPLTVDMFTSPYTETGEGEANRLSALCDGDPNTFWHSWWSQVMDTDDTYGVYFDAALDVPVAALQFDWAVRHNNPNAAPVNWVIGGSNNATSWTVINTYHATPEGNSFTSGEKCSSSVLCGSGAYSNIRFGITESALGTLLGVTTGNSNNDTGKGTGSAAVAELELNIMY